MLGAPLRLGEASSKILSLTRRDLCTKSAMETAATIGGLQSSFQFEIWKFHK